MKYRLRTAIIVLLIFHPLIACGPILNREKFIDAIETITDYDLGIYNITVALELDDDLPPILAHNNRIKQVLFNLIANARDAIRMNSEGEKIITVRTFQENGSVVFAIADPGTGIPDDLKEKIFDPFFTTKEVGKGMGLGLSIIYGIVKGYGGEIALESKDGKGTIFKQKFPAVLS